VSAIQIRRATRRDIDAILRIEDASFGIDAWQAALFLEYLDGCADLFLIAKLNGRNAGYSIACPAPRGAEIDSIAVHPRFRGRGVAQRLMKVTLAALSRRGVHACFLTVRRGNRDAIALYRRLGFVPTRRVPGYYEDGEDGWRMRKRLV
jgi:ribosomal-protein-alanine N-acetyltransferase